MAILCPQVMKVTNKTVGKEEDRRKEGHRKAANLLRQQRSHFRESQLSLKYRKFRRSRCSIYFHETLPEPDERQMLDLEP
jgi:hypothetical protein